MKPYNAILSKMPYLHNLILLFPLPTSTYYAVILVIILMVPAFYYIPLK